MSFQMFFFKDCDRFASLNCGDILPVLKWIRANLASTNRQFILADEAKVRWWKFT